MKKIYLHTFGCPKNITDSELLMHQLTINGMSVVNSPTNADIVMVNTCGFILDAKQESLEFIFEMVKLKKQGRIRQIYVFGCLSERYSDELKEEIPEVDGFFGVYQFKDVLKAINGNFVAKDFYKRSLITPKHYAYIKISDGCNHQCSFCAIPSFKGRYNSKKMGQILKEIDALPKTVKEINIVAQDITYYGKDLYGKNKLGELLKKIVKSDFNGWIRLLYAYPSKFPVEILDIILENKKICKYLDLPVQHISDLVLRSMRRGITKKNLITLIEKIRSKVPDIALRTSVIVGYPNETKKEFRELLDFIDVVKFERLGVFTYSPEEGTHAFNLKDRISMREKEDRKEAVLERQREISLSHNSGKVGKQLEVLIDTEENGSYIGRTEQDAPEIDNSVIIKNGGKNQLEIGKFYKVKVTGFSDYDLFAETINK